MNRAVNYFFIGILLIVSVECCSTRSESSLNRLDRFVDATEKNASSYSANEWELNEKQYEKLLEDIERHYDTMTTEEKDKALKAIGRYNGLLVKYAIKNGVDALEEISKALPSLIDGFTGAFGDEDSESEDYGQQDSNEEVY